MNRNQPVVLAAPRPAPRQLARTLVFRLLLPHGEPVPLPSVLTTRQLAQQRDESVTRVYFDTPERALAARGLALWVANQGPGYVATLEGLRASAGLIADRSTWTAPIAGPLPDLSAFADKDARAQLEGVSGEHLAPICEGEIARRALTIGWPERKEPRALITVVIEQGALTSQSARAPLARLELQAQRGAERALVELAETLRTSLPLGLEFPLAPLPLEVWARAGTPAALKAREVALEPEATIAQSFARIGTNCLTHWLANEALVRASGDVEAVHQLRVALRRLRSAFSLFRPVLPEAERVRLGADMRWLLGTIAPLRDRDVLALEILAPLVEAELLGAELRALARALEDERAPLLERVRAALDDRRCADLALDLFFGVALDRFFAQLPEPERQKVSEPVLPFARAVLARRFRKAEKQGRHFDELDAAGRHALRIAIKKLRYGVEFFATLWPGSQPRKFAKRLAKTQDLLGRLNDLAVAESQLRALLARTGGREQSSSLALASGAVLGWHARTLPDDLARARALWKKLRDRTPFWED